LGVLNKRIQTKDDSVRRCRLSSHGCGNEESINFLVLNCDVFSNIQGSFYIGWGFIVFSRMIFACSLNSLGVIICLRGIFIIVSKWFGWLPSESFGRNTIQGFIKIKNCLSLSWNMFLLMHVCAIFFNSLIILLLWIINFSGCPFLSLPPSYTSHKWIDDWWSLITLIIHLLILYPINRTYISM